MQRAMQLLAAAFEVAVQECDARQQAAFLEVACIIVARHQARRLRQERDAA